jgi:ribosomal protein L37AE/L43A
MSADMATIGTLPASCPFCHTTNPITAEALALGAGWHCVRCGQRWDAARLETVAAYARYVADRAAGVPTHG